MRRANLTEHAPSAPLWRPVLFEEPLKKETRYREIAGIVIMLFALILFLSIASFRGGDEANLLMGRPVGNLMGPFGAWLAGHLRAAFGVPAYLAVAVIAIAGWEVLRRGVISGALERLFALFYLTITSSALMALLAPSSPIQLAGGVSGLFLVRLLESFLRSTGAALVIVIFNVIGLILLGLFSVTATLESARRGKAPVMGFFSRARRVLSSLRRRETAPYNKLEDVIRKRRSGKMPWITRKTVALRGAEATGAGKYDGPVRLLPMQNPVYGGTGLSGDASYEFNDYRSAEESLFNRGYAELSGLEFRGKKDGGRYLPPGESEPDTEPEYASVGAPIILEAYSEPEPAKTLQRGRITGIERDVDEAVIVTDDDDDDIIPETTIRTVRTMKAETDTCAVMDRPGQVYEEIPINQDYIIPTVYLTSSAPADAEMFRNEIHRNSELLVNTLREFGIESRVVKVNRGPVITLYEIQIAPGIKVNRIVGLSDDIALALAASRVRIVAPIPGKSAVGVEVPNLNREMVTLGDIIKAPEYSLVHGKLKVALGKDILGNPVTLDLKKLPHLLIAGATGSGKSVCVNSIITSLIYNYEPNHVRFILVDPKMVELQFYNGLAHLLTPVITEPHIAPRALKWATAEMERRYRLLSAMNTRDIDRYNEKVDMLGGDYEKLPYIVIIMDELADLMMIAAKEIEGFITRIAQKARAVGIHLVLATQRPSVDVITGIIKANFPARIAFQVAQKTDSRTILDQNGAEKLLGKGDMLYQSPMSSFPVRIQGAFISEDEVMSITSHLRKLASPRYIDIEEDIFGEDEEDDEYGGESDELFREALKIVEETKKASASYLQRRLSIGYNRAARMVELMEEKGYVGPQQGSKPREVFL